MAVIKIRGGMKIHTFPPPPLGFDTLKADVRALLQHGFPRRPDWDEDLLERWESLSGLHHVYPEFEPVEHKRHGHRRREEVVAEEELKDNWSGGIVFAKNGATIDYVTAGWTVPAVTSIKPDGEWYYCASWIGIDGDGEVSKDVLQAGVECDVMTTQDNQSQHRIYPWFSWSVSSKGEVSLRESAEIKITNLPVAANDVVNVLICADQSDSSSGYVFFHNTSTKKAVSMRISGPPGAKLVGNCAEWIVERPMVNGVLSRLARFAPVVFNNAVAGTVGSSTIDSYSGENINMINVNGPESHVIAVGELLGPGQVRSRYK